MKKDGVAMVKFFTWFYKKLGKEKLTELGAQEKLAEFRSQQKLYWDESFKAIVAYKANGASPHYAPGKNCNAELKKQGSLLIDSGGAYLDGTTDTTRVIPLGKTTKQLKVDYTLVLKGVIALSIVSFPEGTSGGTLDVLARTSMWEHGIHFMHSTGHGIGFFLSVHEGPQGFTGTKVAMKPGMVTTIEPGTYRAGEHGIRIENMVLCVEKEKTAFGNFLEFETLTYTPINTDLIDKSLLTQKEKDWVNE
jgi:Xaa-Pro aminopeptidase